MERKEPNKWFWIGSICFVPTALIAWLAVIGLNQVSLAVPFNKEKFDNSQLKLKIINDYFRTFKKTNDPLKQQLLLKKKEILKELALEIVNE